MNPQTKCPACGRTVELKPGEGATEEAVALLLRTVTRNPDGSFRVHCDRCGDYGYAMLRIREAIQRTLALVALDPGNKQKLDKLARRFAETACRHWKVRDEDGSYVWDNAFVEQLVFRPDKAKLIMDKFIGIIRHHEQM